MRFHMILRISRPATARGGFTLIELIAVMLLTAILAATAIPAMSSIGHTRETMAAKRLLHSAPEYFFSIPLKRTPQLEYMSIDLDAHYAMKEMDLTDLQFEPATFDAVLSMGVLEHILDVQEKCIV